MARRASQLLLLLCCGCSTAPVADFLDLAFPARPAELKGNARGGVCDPVPRNVPVSGPVAPPPIPIDGGTRIPPMPVPGSEPPPPLPPSLPR